MLVYTFLNIFTDLFLKEIYITYFIYYLFNNYYYSFYYYTHYHFIYGYEILLIYFYYVSTNLIKIKNINRND